MQTPPTSPPSELGAAHGSVAVCGAFIRLQGRADYFDTPLCHARASFVKTYPAETKMKPLYLCARHAKQKQWRKHYGEPKPLNSVLNKTTSFK
jgi:hypothetical protein